MLTSLLSLFYVTDECCKVLTPRMSPSCALVSGNTNKSLRPKEGLTERLSKRVNSRSLTKLLFRILQNSRKNEANVR